MYPDYNRPMLQCVGSGSSEPLAFHQCLDMNQMPGQGLSSIKTEEQSQMAGCSDLKDDQTFKEK